VFGVLIPEVERTVAAGSAEGAVNGVERDCVDGVNFGDVSLCGVLLAVALKGKVEACVFVLDILNSASSLDAANGEACGVGEAAHYASLPLQRTGNSFIDSVGASEVDCMDVALRGADDEKLIARVHGVDALLAFNLCNGNLLSQVSVSDLFVPRACDDHIVSANLDHFNAADRIIMCCNLFLFPRC